MGFSFLHKLSPAVLETVDADPVLLQYSAWVSSPDFHASMCPTQYSRLFSCKWLLRFFSTAILHAFFHKSSHAGSLMYRCGKIGAYFSSWGDSRDAITPRGCSHLYVFKNN
jgi:hypothetical protein